MRGRDGNDSSPVKSSRQNQTTFFMTLSQKLYHLLNLLFTPPPGIYGLFSRDFRRAFRNILCRCKFSEEITVSSLIRQIHMPTFFEDMNEEMDDEGGGGGGGGSGRGGKKKVATGESNDYWMNENVVFQREIYLINKKVSRLILKLKPLNTVRTQSTSKSIKNAFPTQTTAAKKDKSAVYKKREKSTQVLK